MEETKKSLEKKGLKPEVVYVRNDGIVRKRVVIEKGTSLIWYNSSIFPVDMTFRKPHGPQVACDVPINFHQEEKGSYRAEKISTGDLASLCFIEPGMYFYEVSGITPQAKARYYYSTSYKQDYRGVVIVK